MKRFALPALAVSLLVSASGCSSPSKINDHWSIDSVGPRMVRSFTGYEADDWENYRDYADSKKESINLTVKRHFLNWNPLNPFQPEDESRWEERPLNSLLPRPDYYIHAEGLVLGAVAYAAGGAFFPIPIDSILGTLEPGGGAEFVEGFRRTISPREDLSATYYGRDGFFATPSGTDLSNEASYSITERR